MNDTTKQCTKCLLTFPATREYFTANKSKKDGLNGWCKKCQYEYHRKYQQLNHDKLLEYRRAYTETNRDNIAEYMREYQKTNKDRLRKKAKGYALIYKQENRDMYRLSEHRRRARKRQLPDTFTEQQWLICLEYHHYCCAVCGTYLDTPHADHWIPLSHPDCTGTIANNMICLCSVCNQSKNRSMPDIWLKQKYGTCKANDILKRVQIYFEWVLTN